MNDKTEEELTENIEVVLPGVLLQEARVNAKLSTQDIATKLNLKLDYIEHIENNAFDKMPSDIFSRGYLKAYAKLVDANEEDVLAAFEHMCSADEQQLQMRSFSNRKQNNTIDGWVTVISVVVILVVIAGAAMWYMQRPAPTEPAKTEAVQSSTQVESQPSLQTASAHPSQNQTSELEQTVEEQSEPTMSPAGELLAASEEITTSDETPEQALAPDTSEQGISQIDTRQADRADSGQSGAEQLSVDSPDSEQQLAQVVETIEQPEAEIAVEQAEQTNDTQEQTANLSHLELRFSDSCWINIEDATGKRIAIGTKTKGHYTSVHGVAPFTIKLGKPDAVQIWLAGVERTIPYYPKGSIAKFELSLN